MGHWEDEADTTCRIFDKNHLLDATEIFRKLNVHKKVRHLTSSIYHAILLSGSVGTSG